jgi:hypothetical protein
VGVFLREAVKIKPRINRGAAAGDVLFQAPSERRQRRWFFRDSRGAALGAVIGDRSGSGSRTGSVGSTGMILRLRALRFLP